jgi:hypothetical protein
MHPILILINATDFDIKNMEWINNNLTLLFFSMN